VQQQVPFIHGFSSINERPDPADVAKDQAADVQVHVPVPDERQAQGLGDRL
jgi:hypothetical protein